MSDRHILTIGYVPVSCTAETILCGDPETSGTQEVNIIIEDDMVSCTECQFSYDGSHAEWFTPTDKLWTAIVNKCVKPVMREKGDLFFKWQYDVRWTAQRLRNQKKLKPLNLTLPTRSAARKTRSR